MGKYTCITGQNLYDVAMHIYGSIEGITDLLVNNPDLSMATRLIRGQELIFSDDFLIDAETVAYNRIHKVVPANGERHVYFKESAYPRIIEARISPTATSAGMSLSGSGVIEIDWGDDSPLQYIELTDRRTDFSHSFDNKISGERKVRFYGDFRLKQADLSALNPSALLILNPFYIEEFTLQNCRVRLDFLAMLENVYSLDLAKLKTNDLLPIAGCRELMHLDLSGMDVLRENLDDLLIGLVREHYGRRACEVILTEAPSGEYREPARDADLNYVVTSGMEAVWLLVNEPAWNEGGRWRFDICGTIYTKEL
jgi:hypothetical protein